MSSDSSPENPFADDEIERQAEESTEPVALAEVSTQPHPGVLAACFWTFLPILAQTVVGIGISLVAAVAYLVVTGRTHDVQRFLNDDVQVYLLPVGTLTTLLLAVGVSLLVFGRAWLRRLGWQRCTVPQTFLIFGACIPLAVLASEVTNCVEHVIRLAEIGWLEDFRSTGSRVFQEFNQLPFVVVFVGGCLLPGIGEEIYCRGFISRGLVGRYGLIAGTLLTSFLFGAMHMEPVQASGAMFLGVGLQYIFLTTRSLDAPILLHVLNNSLAFLMMRSSSDVDLPGITPVESGGVTHTSWPVLLAAAVATSAFAAAFYQSRSWWVLPDGQRWSPGYMTAESPPAELQANKRSGKLPIWTIGLCLGSLVGLIVCLAWTSR